MNGNTVRFRIKLEVNNPSGKLQFKITGERKNVMSVNLETIPAERTGGYYHKTELVVKCNGTFSSPTALEVYADNEQVGKMNFFPNNKTYGVEVAIVTVKTKRGNTTYSKEPDENLLNSIRRLLGQAYIVPDFQFIEFDLSELVITKPFGSGRRGSEKQSIIDIEAYGGSEEGHGMQPIGIKKGNSQSLIEIIWTNSSEKIDTGDPYGVNRFGG